MILAAAADPKTSEFASSYAETAARLHGWLGWEAPLGLLVMAVAAAILNAFCRRRWSATRDALLGGQLRTLRDEVVLGGIAWGIYATAFAHIAGVAGSGYAIALGLVALAALATVSLRVARVLLFIWLFFNSSGGVPLLLVDLFSLFASLVFVGGVLHQVFLVEVTSLLATSAVASVVLALALQDTLGQLFAGISLQLDRPFRLGDWIEVRSGNERYAGQVMEVSWRATSLLAVSEEFITVPNKTVAQGIVSNFSGRERPFVRGYLFRIALDAPLDLVKEALLEAAFATEGIVTEPPPMPLVIETTESWVVVKMVAFIADYGSQFTIGDAYQTRALKALEARGIRLATSRLRVES